MNRQLIIALDGPSGSGKSTVGRLLAARLGFLYIDTGAMYRALALEAQSSGIPYEDEEGIIRLAEASAMEFVQEKDGQQLLVNGKNVTGRLRTPEIAQGASKVSAIPGVRRRLVRMQQAMGAAGGVVMDGRDIGTVVFPEAGLKIFLDASPEERGHRRYREDLEKGLAPDLSLTLQEMRERDQRDSSRVDSPLRPAADALYLDSTGRSIDSVLAEILALAEARR